jgi:hypothetical protein
VTGLDIPRGLTDGASHASSRAAEPVFSGCLPLRVLDLAYVLFLGAFLGLGSAYAALGGRFPFEAVHVGAWSAWPKTGSQSIDPYARGILARGAYLPLGVGEGLALVATSDDEGRALDGSCRYALTGSVPPTRGWTLNVISPGWPQTSDDRSGFSDAEIIREESGRLAITLSDIVAGGNWLPLPAKSRFSLVLRLYDTPVSSTARELVRDMVPAIRRLGCAGS